MLPLSRIVGLSWQWHQDLLVTLKVHEVATLSVEKNTQPYICWGLFTSIQVGSCWLASYVFIFFTFSGRLYDLTWRRVIPIELRSEPVWDRTDVEQWGKIYCLYDKTSTDLNSGKHCMGNCQWCRATSYYSIEYTSPNMLRLVNLFNIR